MREEFLRLKKEIQSFSFKENIVCLLLYGSIIFNDKNSEDLDGIVVVKKVDSTLNDLFILLRGRYKKLDFNIYSYEEVVGNLSFYTREFKLEYLAEGLCLYGENIFKDEFKKIDRYRYRHSILIRSIEHLQMVRQNYFNSSSDDLKIKYLKKYFLRISKNILLFKGIENHTSVNNLNQDEIMEKLVRLGMFNNIPGKSATESLDEIFNLFSLISEALLKCKKEFESLNISRV